MSILNTLGSALSSGISSLVYNAPTSLASFGLNTLGSVISNGMAQSNAKYWADYNSPVNQMARLKEAGLNPNLVYGNGSAVSTFDGNSNAPTIDSAKFSQLTPSDYVALKTLKSQQSIIESNASTAESEALKAKAEAKTAELNFERQAATQSSDISSTIAKNEGSIYTNSSSYLDLSKSKLESEIDYLKGQYNLSSEQADSIKKTTEANVKKTNEEINSIIKNIENQTRITDATINNLDAQSKASLMNAVSIRIGAEASMKQAEAALKQAYTQAAIGSALIAKYNEELSLMKDTHLSKEVRSNSEAMCAFYEKKIMEVRKSLASTGIFDLSDSELNGLHLSGSGLEKTLYMGLKAVRQFIPFTASYGVSSGTSTTTVYKGN